MSTRTPVALLPRFQSLAQSLAMAVALRVAMATTLVCILVFSLVYAGLAHQTRQALQTTIDTDLAGLVDIYADQGQAGLSARLAERLDLAPTASERPVYVLIDGTGKPVIGNNADWPSLKPELSEAGYVKASDGHRLLARVTQLKGGVKLMVARSTALGDSTMGQIRLLFLAGIFGMAVAAFFVGNFAARRLRGRVQQLNAVFDSLQDSGGTTLRADMSDRRDEIDDLGQNVNATLDRVERLLKAQRDVSDNIAHEVRTPLMVLNQKIDDALARTADDGVAKSLEAAQGQVRSVLRLLDALLDIASAEAQRGDMRNLSDVDLSELAHGMAELYSASAEDAGMTLTADIADGIVMRADAMQMSRLLVNLFDNAIKYGAQGHAIRFSVAPGPVITVEDDGPGVPDAEKARIFDRYHRAPELIAKGHGLGLALVSAIAARHCLTVRVEDTHPDKVNKGARFVVAGEETR